MKVLGSIALALAIAAGTAGCAFKDPVAEGNVLEIRHEAARCEKYDKNRKCTKTDDEDCDLLIKPSRRAGQSEAEHAKVEPVVVEVPCNSKYFDYKVGDYWYR